MMCEDTKFNLPKKEQQEDPWNNEPPPPATTQKGNTDKSIEKRSDQDE